MEVGREKRGREGRREEGWEREGERKGGREKERGWKGERRKQQRPQAVKAKRKAVREKQDLMYTEEEISQNNYVYIHVRTYTTLRRCMYMYHMQQICPRIIIVTLRITGYGGRRSLMAIKLLRMF